MNLRKVIWGQMNVTSKIILLNVVTFIVTYIGLAINPHFIEYVALKPSSIVHGINVWTLLTSIFVHAGFEHLFFNMFSLWFLGSFVERIIGRKRLIGFYLVAGIFAGVFFSVVSGFFGYGIGEKIFGNPVIYGVGASGAIFGLVGLVTVLTPLNRVYLIAGPLLAIVLQSIIDALLPNSIISGVLSLLLSVYILVSIFSIFSLNERTRKIALAVEMPFWILPIISIIPLVVIGLFVDLPIGNMAHFGGLIVGLAYGWYLRVKYRKKVKLLSKYFH